jgi:hypothetical protein
MLEGSVVGVNADEGSARVLPDAQSLWTYDQRGAYSERNRLRYHPWTARHVQLSPSLRWPLRVLLEVR